MGYYFLSLYCRAIVYPQLEVVHTAVLTLTSDPDNTCYCLLVSVHSQKEVAKTGMLSGPKRIHIL